MTGYSFTMENENLLGLLSGLAAGIPASLLNLAGYVLTALALYTLARRRGLNKPWLAWVPVANVWLLGSLSDQYQYVVRGQNKSKRKWLLGLGVVEAALAAAMSVSLVNILVSALGGMMQGLPENVIVRECFSAALKMVGLTLPMAAVSIAYAVIRLMALYDVYRSMDPGNATVFLVLSILFKVTQPFFLFFCRNKDDGMPPRREPETVFTAAPEADYTAKRDYPYWGETPQEPQPRDEQEYL